MLVEVARPAGGRRAARASSRSRPPPAATSRAQRAERRVAPAVLVRGDDRLRRARPARQVGLGQAAPAADGPEQLAGVTRAEYIALSMFSGHRQSPAGPGAEHSARWTPHYRPSAEVAAIRGRIDHPIIDADGHIIEYLPLVRDILVELGGRRRSRQRFDLVVDSGRLDADAHAPSSGAALALMRIPWWGIPTRNTLDRGTAMLPAAAAPSGSTEIGIDVAVLYPTYGLTAIHLDRRRAAAARSSRAFNTYVAEVYAPYRDRILPVACIPTFTPEEAIAELEHAVGELGLARS